jgi:hypothetical protein
LESRDRFEWVYGVLVFLDSVSSPDVEWNETKNSAAETRNEELGCRRRDKLVILEAS